MRPHVRAVRHELVLMKLAVMAPHMTLTCYPSTHPVVMAMVDSATRAIAYVVTVDCRKNECEARTIDLPIRDAHKEEGKCDCRVESRVLVLNSGHKVAEGRRGFPGTHNLDRMRLASYQNETVDPEMPPSAVSNLHNVRRNCRLDLCA